MRDERKRLQSKCKETKKTKRIRPDVNPFVPLHFLPPNSDDLEVKESPGKGLGLFVREGKKLLRGYLIPYLGIVRELERNEDTPTHAHVIHEDDKKRLLPSCADKNKVLILDAFEKEGGRKFLAGRINERSETELTNCFFDFFPENFTDSNGDTCPRYDEVDGSPIQFHELKYRVFVVGRAKWKRDKSCLWNITMKKNFHGSVKTWLDAMITSTRTTQ